MFSSCSLVSVSVMTVLLTFPRLFACDGHERDLDETRRTLSQLTSSLEARAQEGDAALQRDAASLSGLTGGGSRGSSSALSTSPAPVSERERLGSGYSAARGALAEHEMNERFAREREEEAQRRRAAERRVFYRNVTLVVFGGAILVCGLPFIIKKVSWNRFFCFSKRGWVTQCPNDILNAASSTYPY